MKATIVLALAAFAAAQTTTAPASSGCIQQCLNDAVNDTCGTLSGDAQVACACQRQGEIQGKVAGCQIVSHCAEGNDVLQALQSSGSARCAAVSSTSMPTGSMNQTMTMTSTEMSSETSTETSSESESESKTTMTPTTTSAATTTSQTSSTSNAAVAGAPAGALAALLAAAFAL